MYDRRLVTNQKGAVLLLTAVILASVTVLLGFLWSRVGGFVYTEGKAHLDEKVLAITEGGLDKAIWELNEDSSYAGETGTLLGDGTVTITVENLDATTKRITSTGYIPDSTNPIAQKVIGVEVLLSSSIVSFDYGVHTGNGGLILDNNNTVQGNVYANGSITAANNAKIVGDTWIAGNVAPNESAIFLTQNTEYQFGHTSSTRDVAQSFVPTVSGKISKVRVLLRKNNKPSSLTVRVVTEVSGNPGGSAQQIASGTLDSNWVTSTQAWIEIPIVSTAAVNVGQKYWLILDGGSDSSKYYWWGADSASGYAPGLPKSSANWSSGGWSAIANRDLNFQVFVGGTTTGFYGTNNVNVYGDLHANEIKNVNISGDAYYDSIINAWADNYYPGSEDPPALPFPLSQAQIDEWKVQAEAGGVHSGNYTTCVSSLGPKRVSGNMTLGNNCTLTVTGLLWITGDLVADNNITIRLDPSFGGNGGVIVVSGKILLNNNIQILGSGQSDSYVLLISELDSDTPPAIELSNNNSVEGIVYASNGKVLLNNNANVLEITGETIHLSNNVDIVYETGLANMTITGGSTSGWSMRDGTWVER